MKAVVLSGPGGPEVLKIQEVNKPSPSPTQVLIKIEATSVNRPDIAIRNGKYPGVTEVKGMILGLDLAGVVESVGAQVTKWKQGDKVCALVKEGGYAQYAVVDEANLLHVPKGWSAPEAASLPETVYTVWHNVFQRGGLKKGERFLVHGGSSGIGVTAIQLATAFGAQAFATAGTDEKCRECEELGAARCFNYKTQDFEKELKDEGVDVILDMIGGDYIAKNLKILRPDGRLVFINAMQGPIGQFDVKDVMARRLTITGSTLRAREQSFKAQLTEEIERHVWPVMEQRRFKPVIFRTLPLEDVAEAHKLLEAGTHTGKLVMTVGGHH